jgi:hypothetical protein
MREKFKRKEGEEELGGKKRRWMGKEKAGRWFERSGGSPSGGNPLPPKRPQNASRGRLSVSGLFTTGWTVSDLTFAYLPLSCY